MAKKLFAKNGLKQECKPHLESVRALNTLAERVRMTILVVDDDEFQHEFVKGFLPETGYHQIHANSGAEALNLLRKIRPDLILMDIVMPDMDGIEATRRIRKIPQLAGVPVIMVTGNSGKDAVKESIEAGATNFIVKPFDRATLLAKIALAMRP